jgi:dTDP-3-amino-3,4,6-trideoxy-alpha-D-glucose transaminase
MERAQPAWHLYVVAHARADELIAALDEQGIEARGYYRTPVHRQPTMSPYVADELKGTDQIARTNLALPMSTALAPAQVDEVVAAIERATAGLERARA